MFEQLLESPLVHILVGALPATMLGVLAHRQSVKADRVAELSGIASSQRSGTAQVIEGMNALADNLQVDNAQLRIAVRECATNMALVMTERDDLLRQVRQLAKEGG